MAALTRIGTTLARSTLFSYQRNMATATTASDPVQRIFIDKIKEFKNSNKGLDQAHSKAMDEEMLRLKRVYSIKDESKLAQVEAKFSSESDISLRDIDESGEIRAKVESGEFLSNLPAEQTTPSELMASIPDQTPPTNGISMPNYNKPWGKILIENHGQLKPAVLGECLPDYYIRDTEVTPAKLEEQLLVRFGKNMPTIDDDKKPERDAVNFPRIRPRLFPPETRFHLIPETWFEAFYGKTGQTGLYTLMASFSTFLLSKELVVIEHEAITAFSMASIIYIGVTKFGPKLSAYIKEQVDNEINGWKFWQTGHIDLLSKLTDHYKNELKKKELIEQLYDIRAQDVEVQIESEYRNRVKSLYTETKRRLDYLVAVAESQKQITYRNMVNWVISNSIASIGQKQESEVLDNCISDLKRLASKNANVI